MNINIYDALEVPNGRIFLIKYFEATNTKGSRIKIIDERFNTSITLNRSYKHINGIYDALEYMKERGINIIAKGDLNHNSDILISDDFDINLRGNKNEKQ